MARFAEDLDVRFFHDGAHHPVTILQELHPGLSTTQDDCDWFIQTQTIQSFFLNHSPQPCVSTTPVLNSFGGVIAEKYKHNITASA